MDTVITIDQGNTLSKICVFRGNELVETERVDALSIECVGAIAERYESCGAIYSSVTHVDPKFVESLRHIIDGDVMTLTPSSPLPVKIDYRSPKSLGTDRIAAVAGAWRLFAGRPMLVVDAGSALTIDVIDAQGVFRGGNISPGIDMRLKALHSFTDRLPEVDREGDLPEFGVDTVTALRCGAVRGAAAEIIQAFEVAKSLYGCDAIALTGGNARMLAEVMTQYIDNNIINMAENLVDFGLLSIFEYNENI